MKKKQELIIEIPEGFKIEVEGGRLTLSDGKDSVNKEFKAKEIKFSKKNNSVILSTEKYSRRAKALMNSIKANIENMVEGLTKGYEYRLAIVYSHFPINVSVKGNLVEINNFTGEKRPRKAQIIGNTKVEIKGKEIIVTGKNKEHAGQTAANLENATRIREKDRRIFQDGIFIVSKNAR
ncbi:MAG: 50S ribosomal protein L6 [Candidatus Diapherotrites archaeon]